MKTTAALARVRSFMTDKKWKPFPFQEEVWRAYLAGESGLLHAPTGMGKTLAVWLGPIAEWLRDASEHEATPGLTVLWITPLRALATDTEQSLREPVEVLDLPWTLALRTGDTSSSVKARVRKTPPSALVTTPESLSLLLSHEDSAKSFAALKCVIVDEWHDLLGTMRGVQTELCLARLRALAPGLRTWGLSATIGNVAQAAEVLLGGPGATIIADHSRRKFSIETVIPETVEKFPWGGHTGLRLLARVIEALESSKSTLLFTNVRSQCETWYRAIIEQRPEWKGEVGIHHGSIDREFRQCVEQLLALGKMRCVVCTSSLDLGVDFSPVDQVIQIGSPKGIARLLQRAGRSGHQPGSTSRVLCVPAHAMELVDFSVARELALAGKVESRKPILRPLDLLSQHLVTIAAGGGFVAADMLAEVRTTYAYRELTDEEWEWTLQFITTGGPSLGSYPGFHRVMDANGRHVLKSESLGKLHRLNIGTITSDGAIAIKFANGSPIGSVEESFIAKLRPGDSFLFGGRMLKLLRVNGMGAHVAISKATTGVVPRWMGGRISLSTQLAAGIRARIGEAARDNWPDAEMIAIKPLMTLQQKVSHLPVEGELLIESIATKEGHHTYLFPFAGRLVHEGLSILLAYRISRSKPVSISLFLNDLGMELLSTAPIEASEEQWRVWLSPENLQEDLLACANMTELARRRFRDIARIAGLVMTGFPGKPKTTRQIQVSSSLLFDVFTRFDPENLLLKQARRDVLEHQLAYPRMLEILTDTVARKLVIKTPQRLTPLAFPLWAERFRDQVSSESWEDRVRRMSEELLRAADEPAEPAKPRKRTKKT